jgi:(p)ppGpp synthase/HD superfamily hydrolase
MSIELWKKRPPGYELFFASLATSLDPLQYERIHFAYMASKFGHEGQVRDDGTRYFDHPKAAAWIFIDELGGRNVRVIIDTLLHDMSEDSHLLSPYRLALNFDQDIALDVRAMTKLPKGKETPKEYLHRVVVRGPQAITAKLLDRVHNNRSLCGCALDKRKKQVEETETYHRPILIPALRAHGGEWLAHADALESRMNQALDVYR